MPAPDPEVAEIMHRLSDLQAWCVLMTRKDSGGIAAADLVQETRCLIVERLYTSPAQAIEARRDETGTGSVHESPVAESDAPDLPPSPSPSSKDRPDE